MKSAFACWAVAGNLRVLIFFLSVCGVVRRGSAEVPPVVRLAFGREVSVFLTRVVRALQDGAAVFVVHLLSFEVTARSLTGTHFKMWEGTSASPGRAGVS